MWAASLQHPHVAALTAVLSRAACWKHFYCGQRKVYSSSLPHRWLHIPSLTSLLFLVFKKLLGWVSSTNAQRLLGSLLRYCPGSSVVRVVKVWETSFIASLHVISPAVLGCLLPAAVLPVEPVSAVEPVLRQPPVLKRVLLHQSITCIAAGILKLHTHLPPLFFVVVLIQCSWIQTVKIIAVA